MKSKPVVYLVALLSISYAGGLGAQSCCFECFKASVSPNHVSAQSPPQQSSKEAKKQAERERKEQEKKAKKQRNFEAAYPINILPSYDRFNDVRTFALEPMHIPASFNNINDGFISFKTYAAFQVKGMQRTVPTTVAWGFVSDTNGWAFAQENNRNLTLLIDDERLGLGIPAHQGRIFPRSVEETVMVLMSYETFLRIANAKRVEVQLGRYEFVLLSRHLEGFRCLINPSCE